MIVSGKVLKGRGVGRALGFPTLNLNPENAPKSLKFGVYAAKVVCGTREFKGVLHYGPRPTHEFSTSFEVHVFGLDEDLYGKEISVEIKKRIRDVKKFESEEELKNAIAKDVAAAQAG